MARVTVDTVLHLRDFGLERLEEDKAIVGFAEKAQARLVRWLDFAKGALLFLMVPGDRESGMFYIYDATGRPSIRSRSRSSSVTAVFARTSSNLSRKPLTSLHLRGIRGSCGPSAPVHFWSYLRHGP
jgi:hypothetical protein